MDIPSGFPGNPLRSEDHIDLFRDAAAYGGRSLSEEKIDKIISMVHHLEDVKDIRSSIPLLLS